MWLSKLAITLISPLGAALLLGVVALLSRRWRLWLGCAGLLWLYAWSTPLASNWIRLQLEERYPQHSAGALQEAEAIVVLGGAVSPTTVHRSQVNLSSAVDRVWFAAQLYHAGKAPLVVLSGGSDPTWAIQSEAAAMRTLLLELSVPESALLLEEQSRTTRENAHFSARLLGERGIRKILLVTSALHMRRARVLFEAQGLKVIPAATDYEASPAAWYWQYFLPDAASLDGSAQSMKEIIGRWAGA